MAGDWIKVENITPDKPEVFRIAESLGIDPDAVLGKLVRVWVWADTQTYDGNAVSVTRSLLDRVTGVAGFTDAMKDVGWLAESGEGLVFPHFDRHNGQSAKSRALTAKRVSKHRWKCNADSVTQSVTRALPEKRREEKSKNTPLPPSGGSVCDSESREEESGSPHTELVEIWYSHRNQSVPHRLPKSDTDYVMELLDRFSFATSSAILARAARAVAKKWPDCATLSGARKFVEETITAIEAEDRQEARRAEEAAERKRQAADADKRRREEDDTIAAIRDRWDALSVGERKRRIGPAKVGKKIAERWAMLEFAKEIGQ